jgi:hypothetical protein
VGRSARGGRLRIGASHRFSRTTIESRWTVTAGSRYRAYAHFPSWGAHTVIEAVRRDGTRVPLTAGVRMRLADVGAVQVGRGYRVVPLRAPRGTVMRAVPVERQRTNPNPGPSLRVEVRRGELAVRIEPAA